MSILVESQRIVLAVGGGPNPILPKPLFFRHLLAEPIQSEGDGIEWQVGVIVQVFGDAFDGAFEDDVCLGHFYVVEFHFEVSGLEGQAYDARAGEEAEAAADLFEQDGETVDEEDIAGVGGGQQFVGVEGVVGRG